MGRTKLIPELKGRSDKKKEGAGEKANSFRTELIGGNHLQVVQIGVLGGMHMFALKTL